jgi:hypothetical protein
MKASLEMAKDFQYSTASVRVNPCIAMKMKMKMDEKQDEDQNDNDGDQARCIERDAQEDDAPPTDAQQQRRRLFPATTAMDFVARNKDLDGKRVLTKDEERRVLALLAIDEDRDEATAPQLPPQLPQRPPQRLPPQVPRGHIYNSTIASIESDEDNQTRLASIDSALHVWKPHDSLDNLLMIMY